MIFVEDGNGPKQIFMILLHIMSMIKQQKYTCDWTWTRIVNEWMYSLRLLHCVNIWCSRESDEKRPISNFPKLSESKLFCLRARLSTNNQSLRLWFRVSTEELYSRISDCHLKQNFFEDYLRPLLESCQPCAIENTDTFRQGHETHNGECTTLFSFKNFDHC